MIARLLWAWFVGDRWYHLRWADWDRSYQAWRSHCRLTPTPPKKTPRAWPVIGGHTLADDYMSHVTPIGPRDEFGFDPDGTIWIRPG